MPEGGKFTIQTRPNALRDEPAVTIEFADTGCGMSDEQTKNAFVSILQTTKKSGTGLGLALVGKIVDAHGGEIKVPSRERQGTTFRITLPVLGKKLDARGPNCSFRPRNLWVTGK